MELLYGGWGSPLSMCGGVLAVHGIGGTPAHRGSPLAWGEPSVRGQSLLSMELEEHMVCGGCRLSLGGSLLSTKLVEPSMGEPSMPVVKVAVLGIDGAPCPWGEPSTRGISGD